MTESNEQSINPVENDGLSLKLFKEQCCDNCACQRESTKVKESDSMGREKFWEDLGRP